MNVISTEPPTAPENELQVKFFSIISPLPEQEYEKLSDFKLSEVKLPEPTIITFLRDCEYTLIYTCPVLKSLSFKARVSLPFSELTLICGIILSEARMTTQGTVSF